MNARRFGFASALAVLPCVLLAQYAPKVLPVPASAQLARSLAAAAPHAQHVWRDVPSMNPDGTVNGYIEIPLGDRNKYEFDMTRNARAIDRVIAKDVGGYPINYGFVPQTVSYDGDPFDILVLGPALRGGEIVRGVIVGLMYMEDEKGLDSKIVVSPITPDGRARYELTPRIREELADYFRRYKRNEAGKSSKVPGWGTIGEGRELVATTHSFFLGCREATGPCRVR